MQQVFEGKLKDLRGKHKLLLHDKQPTQVSARASSNEQNNEEVASVKEM